MILPVIRIAGAHFSAVQTAVEKAEKATISDCKTRFPPIVKKAVRARYKGLAKDDPGLKPRVKFGKAAASFLSVGARLASMRFAYRGIRKSLDILGLGADFTGRLRDPVTGRKTEYGRQWAQARKPYKVHTPLKRREPFGSDKRGLFAVRSKTSGVPLLFQRKENSREIAAVVSIATPQAIRQKETVADWRPKLNDMLRKRLQHHLQRFGASAKA